MQFPQLSPSAIGFEAFQVEPDPERLVLVGAYCWYGSPGPCKFRIQGGDTSLPAGRLAVINRGTGHQILKSKAPIYCLRIRRSGFANQQRIDQRAQHIVEATAAWAKTTNFILPLKSQAITERFMDCCKGSHGPLERKAAVLYLLALIGKGIPDDELTQGPAASPARIRELIELLHSQYTETFSVADALSLTGMTRSTFHTAFRRATGTTFNRYLTSLRISVAQRKLLNSSDSVLSIAFDCGFGSSSRFHDAFKKETGTTPEHFRRDARTSGKQ